MRLVFLTGIFMVLQPKGEAPFPWLALITPGALFFLMALFWLWDSVYLVYRPLYLAGKGFSVISFMFWLLFAGKDMIRDLLFGRLAHYIVPGAVFFLLLGDMLSVWTVMLITKGKKASNS
jgi:hypothetical protein